MAFKVRGEGGASSPCESFEVEGLDSSREESRLFTASSLAGRHSGSGLPAARFSIPDRKSPDQAGGPVWSMGVGSVFLEPWGENAV